MNSTTVQLHKKFCAELSYISISAHHDIIDVEVLLFVASLLVASIPCVVASLGEANSHNEVASLKETGSLDEAASHNEEASIDDT